MSGPIAEADFAFCPSDAQQYPGRALFYIENAQSLEQAQEIGMSLHVERKIFSRYASMETDILAPVAAAHLREVCGK
jgi:hypothetical protein